MIEHKRSTTNISLLFFKIVENEGITLKLLLQIQWMNRITEYTNEHTHISKYYVS